MPSPRMIQPTEDFPIKPADIDVNIHFWDAFGNSQTETSAHHIVRLMQLKGDWVPFTRTEIDAVYNQSGIRSFSFNHLLGEFNVFSVSDNRWTKRTERLDVIVEQGGLYYVTDEFILRCYRSSPIVRMKPVLQPV